MIATVVVIFVHTKQYTANYLILVYYKVLKKMHIA